jgi:hypothetical protein
MVFALAGDSTMTTFIGLILPRSRAQIVPHAG